MEVLFTGATSLAARSFVPLLRQRGHRVTCVSRRPLPMDESVVADLASEGSERLLPNRSFDALIHFASFVPVQERLSTWNECYSPNVEGTAKVLQWAEGRVGRIILASSCAVYGARSTSAPLEETDPLLPDTYYAITKYAQEQLVSSFCIPRSIPYSIMRLGYVYGPGISEQRAIVKFIKAVQAGKDITLRNPTSAGLFLIHTAEIAEIGLRLLQQGNGIYNVVSEEFVSLLDYVEAVMRVCGKRVNVIQQEDQTFGRTGWYSLSRLKSEGLHSAIGLEAGIRTLLSKEAESCHA